MLFSVLIAHYNNARFLRTALQSVIGQTYTNWEIVIVDDASTDEFKNIVAPYSSDPRIKILHNDQNQGCGYTKRKCVEKAKGSILGFLDPDDSLEPDALKVMIAAHHRRPECSIIHSTHYICNPELNVLRTADYVKALPENIPYLLLNDGRIHHFASFKKHSYAATAGISALNKKAVDQDLYYKLEETGAVFFINQPLYNYRIHEGSISTFGKERSATLWHYAVIEDACLRRISYLQQKKQRDATADLLKVYRAKYHKTRILSTFKTKKWVSLIYHLTVYPFIGGWSNLTGYAAKLPKGGIRMLRNSLVHDHKINI